jgi:hypothetical protein
MISRGAKALYYALMGLPMRLNGFLYKAFRAPHGRNKKIIKVQLGPGQTNYLDGWINLDANFITAKCDATYGQTCKIHFLFGVARSTYSTHTMLSSICRIGI